MDLREETERIILDGYNEANAHLLKQFLYQTRSFSAVHLNEECYTQKKGRPADGVNSFLFNA